MAEVWANPANWTTEQWMAVCIMVFVIIAILVLIHRLLAIIQMSRKQSYKPNLRRLRSSRPGSSFSRRDGSRSGDDEDEK